MGWRKKIPSKRIQIAGTELCKRLGKIDELKRIWYALKFDDQRVVFVLEDDKRIELCLPNPREHELVIHTPTNQGMTRDSNSWLFGWGLGKRTRQNQPENFVELVHVEGCELIFHAPQKLKDIFFNLREQYGVFSFSTRRYAKDSDYNNALVTFQGVPTISVTYNNETTLYEVNS